MVEMPLGKVVPNPTPMCAGGTLTCSTELQLCEYRVGATAGAETRARYSGRGTDRRRNDDRRGF